MIERYSRKVMRDIWTEENKFDAYLKVEILSCEAWSELGVIPKEDVDKIRRDARFDVARIQEMGTPEEVFGNPRSEKTRSFIRGTQESF